MSRAYLAEWVRQLCADGSAALDTETLTTAELTELILLFATRATSTDVQA